MYNRKAKAMLDIAYELNKEAYLNDPTYNAAVKMLAEGGLNALNVLHVINQLCINNKGLREREKQRIKNENVRYIVLGSE